MLSEKDGCRLRVSCTMCKRYATCAKNYIDDYTGVNPLEYSPLAHLPCSGWEASELTVFVWDI